MYRSEAVCWGSLLGGRGMPGRVTVVFVGVACGDVLGCGVMCVMNGREDVAGMSIS